MVLVASPLVAKTIVSGGAWSGSPPLLVPEWHSEAVPSQASPSEAVPSEASPATQTPGLWAVATDPIPAYREAGAAAGAFVAALAREGGSPSCGLLFSASPIRPRAALDAFAAGYSAASEGASLQVRELAAAAEDKVAETAVEELLGSDLRILFVALGSTSGAAIRKAARPGLAIGLDSSAPEVLPALAFRVRPDDEALAKAVAQRRLQLGKSDNGDRICLVPAKLIAEAQATQVRAGKVPFSRFLAKATLGAKAPEVRP